MRFRPLSFTKNLGGLQNLHLTIREAYAPGITMNEFGRRVPRELKGRRLVVQEFFLATRVEGGVEYVVPDTLIEWSLSHRWDATTARLYLFALLLNMPGQRLKSEYQSPAGGQNAFVREVLHDGQGWLVPGLDVNKSVEPWVAKNVAVRGAARKFSTNLHHFFDQCKFSPAGRYFDTEAELWAPISLRLFFDRLRLELADPTVDEMTARARDAELHKLFGVSEQWLLRMLDGASVAYRQGDMHLLSAPRAVESQSQSSGPAARRTAEINRLIRIGANKQKLSDWYGGLCQICGLTDRTAATQAAVDFAHIQPLGAPHNGPDVVSNMLSLCPNHHRQFDRGAIGIEPTTLAIQAPHGSAPRPLAKLHVHSSHKVGAIHLKYHNATVFKP